MLRIKISDVIILKKKEDYNTGGQCEQYTELPRAIGDPNGMPHKGDKLSQRVRRGIISYYGEPVCFWPRHYHVTRYVPYTNHSNT